MDCVLISGTKTTGGRVSSASYDTCPRPRINYVKAITRKDQMYFKQLIFHSLMDAVELYGCYQIARLFSSHFYSNYRLRNSWSCFIYLHYGCRVSVYCAPHCWVPRNAFIGYRSALYSIMRLNHKNQSATAASSTYSIGRRPFYNKNTRQWSVFSSKQDAILPEYVCSSNYYYFCLYFLDWQKSTHVPKLTSSTAKIITVLLIVIKLEQKIFRNRSSWLFRSVAHSLEFPF